MANKLEPDTSTQQAMTTQTQYQEINDICHQKITPGFNESAQLLIVHCKFNSCIYNLMDNSKRLHPPDFNLCHVWQLNHSY